MQTKPNRHERRALAADQHKYARNLPEHLTEIDPAEFPLMPIMPIQMWRSRKYAVQLYKENNPYHSGLMRLSVSRATYNQRGTWDDGLTWDELNAIKTELGYAHWYGIELYPPVEKLINVANFRHIWLLPIPLSIGWGF